MNSAIVYVCYYLLTCWRTRRYLFWHMRWRPAYVLSHVLVLHNTCRTYTNLLTRSAVEASKSSAKRNNGSCKDHHGGSVCIKMGIANMCTKEFKWSNFGLEHPHPQLFSRSQVRFKEARCVVKGLSYDSPKEGVSEGLRNFSKMFMSKSSFGAPCTSCYPKVGQYWS